MATNDDPAAAIAAILRSALHPEPEDAPTVERLRPIRWSDPAVRAARLPTAPPIPEYERAGVSTAGRLNVVNAFSFEHVGDGTVGYLAEIGNVTAAVGILGDLLGLSDRDRMVAANHLDCIHGVTEDNQAWLTNDDREALLVEIILLTHSEQPEFELDPGDAERIESAHADPEFCGSFGYDGLGTVRAIHAHALAHARWRYFRGVDGPTPVGSGYTIALEFEHHGHQIFETVRVTRVS